MCTVALVNDESGAPLSPTSIFWWCCRGAPGLFKYQEPQCDFYCAGSLVESADADQAGMAGNLAYSLLQGPVEGQAGGVLYKL